MDVKIKVAAYSFPTIALVLGFLLLLTGTTSNNPDLTSWGGMFVVIGIIAYIIPILVSVIGD